MTDIQEPQRMISPVAWKVGRVVLTAIIIILWVILIFWLDYLRGDAACVFGC